MSEEGTLRRFTIAELAEQEFHARERLRAMDMMNVPTDYEERKKAAIALAEAQAEAVRAKLALDHAINNPVQ